MILITLAVQTTIVVMYTWTAKPMLYFLFVVGCVGLILKYPLIILLIALLLYKYILKDS